MLSLALAFTVSACGGSTVTGPVTIKTLDPTSQETCYLTGVAGDLVTDPTTGTAIIDDAGGRVALTWPNGWTARSSWFGVEVLSERGTVAYRTGTHVDLMGDFSHDDETFVVCWLELVP